MLAAVPSVVVGLWGIYVLAPFDAQHLQPFLGSVLGWIPIFAHGGDKVESTVFSAMLVLTIMIIPITSSICRELFLGVPDELEEGAVGLGATRWEMVKTVVVPSVRGGVVAAVILGLGRALGEAIAVTQVIGNFTPLKLSIFEPGDTLASRIAEPVPGRGLEPPRRLADLPRADPARDHLHHQPRGAARRQAVRVQAMSEPTRRTSRLRATGRSRRRLIKNRLAEAAAFAAAFAAILVLGILVWSVFSRGVHALSWDFFTKGPALFGQTGGGVAPALVGSLLLVGIATVMALPIGVLTAIFVSEFAPPRFGAQVRLWLDVLNGFPSIVDRDLRLRADASRPSLPIVGWGHHQSAFAGAFALSIIMLPLVARATMEVLALVAERAARREPRARRLEVADRVARRAADRVRRDPDRHDARDRPRCRRDGAAALHLRARRSDGRLESDPLRQLDPVHDLPVLGGARS